jgi:hypothetical protein
MQTQDAGNIQLSVLLSPVVGVHHSEMSRLGKPVDDYPNGVKLVGRPTIKFMLMSSHFQARIFIGCNNPAGLI